MHGNHGLVNVRHVGVDASNQLPKLRRGGVANGVGNVDGGGTGGDGRFDHLVHKFRITAAGVFAGELDIVDQGAGVGHHLGGDRQHLSAGFAQFVLEVDVARGNKGMDAAIGRRSHGVGTGLDIAPGRPGKPTDNGSINAAHHLSDALDSAEIPGAGEGETGLDDVHSQAGELLGDRQLLLQVQAGARRLLSVPQGGIEDQYPARIAGHTGTSKRNDYELRPL